MKKSLLTLVLAGVAATATAGTIYSNVSGETKTNLDFYGSLKVVGDKGHVNSTNYSGAESVQVKERDRAVFVRSRFGLKGEYTDGTLTYAFNTRFTNSYTYVTTQARPHTGPETPVKEAARVRSGYNLDFGYLTLSHKQLGSLTYGKTGTVLDLVEGSDSNSFSNVAYTVLAAPSVYKNTFIYKTPEFYGVNAVASYGSEAPASVSGKNKQFGFGLEANKFNTNLGVYFAKSTSKVGAEITGKANSVAVHAVNKSVNGLTVSLTGSYERTKVPGSTSSERTEAYGVGGKVAYAVNQYVNPYAGASFAKYNFARNTLANGEVSATDTSKQKVASAYVGLSSTLVKYQDFNLSTFGEFVYSRNVNKVETSTVQRHNSKLGSVGLTASF